MQVTYFGTTDKEGYSSFWAEIEVRVEMEGRDLGPFSYQASQPFDEKDLEDEDRLLLVVSECTGRCIEAVKRWIAFQSRLQKEKMKADEAYRKIEAAIEEILEEIDAPISFSFWQMNILSLATCEYNNQSPEEAPPLKYEGEACELFKSKGYRDLMRVFQHHKVIQ